MVDWIDGVLSVGSFFDWISPVVNELTGFRHGYMSTRNYQKAVQACEGLKRRGIPARVEGNPISGYMVFTKEKVSG